MECKQLVGPYAGQIIDLPFAVYQACKAAGTVVDVDAEHAVKGLKRGAVEAPKPEANSPESKVSVEPRRGVVVPMLLPETGIDALNLPAINRPEDVGQIYFRKFSGHETVADGIYCEHGWPALIEFAVEFLNDEGFKIDNEGRLEITVTNGIALYQPIGVFLFDKRLVFAQFLEGEFEPITPPANEAQKSVPDETSGNDEKLVVEIPANWMDQHHNWKRARAAEISRKPVGSKAEAEEIIKAYLAQK